MLTCKMFILKVDSICDMSLNDDNELELNTDNDELLGTIPESSARISPRYNSIEFSNTEQ